MAVVDDAIRELLKTELTQLRELVDSKDERIAASEKAVEGLNERLAEHGQAVEQLKGSLQEAVAKAEEQDARVRALEGLDLGLVKGRLERLEDDTEGIGGLKQVHERLTKLATQLGESQQVVQEAKQIAATVKSRADELEQKVQVAARQCEESTSLAQACDRRLQTVEAVTSEVREAQRAIEDSVAKKYEKLWEDVLHAIEEMKDPQLERLQLDLDSHKRACRQEAQSLVNYGLKALAAAHEEKRQVSITKALVHAWREQTWISARRRVGIQALHSLSQRKKRNAFDRMVRAAAVHEFARHLTAEYDKKVPDVHKILNDLGLPQRCDRLGHEVAAIHKDKCPHQRLDDELLHQSRNFEEKLGRQKEDLDSLQQRASQELQAKCEEQCRAAQRVAEALDAKIADVTSQLEGQSASLAECAQSKEVQGMIRDVLLVWNSIKQLDVAKADKKDVESFALECSNREKLAVRRVDEVEADVTKKTQDVERTRNRCSQLEERVEAHSRQVTHWEQMWEKLAGYVEDLVAKIAELQQSGGHIGSHLPALPAGRVRSSSVPRTPSKQDFSRGRGDMTTLPPYSTASTNVSDALAGAEAPPPPNGVPVPAPWDATVAKAQWVAAGRSLTETTMASMDQVAPSSARLRPSGRPKSASVRRPVDRSHT